MKLTDKIQEKISERNKLFLALDIIFTLSTVIFAIWSIWISIPVLFGERIPTYDPTETIVPGTRTILNCVDAWHVQGESQQKESKRTRGPFASTSFSLFNTVQPFFY